MFEMPKGGEEMSIIINQLDLWEYTGGKCRCGRKLKRPQFYCSVKCYNDAMDAVEFDEDFRDIKESDK